MSQSAQFTLRKTLRNRRQKLSPLEQQVHAEHACQHLINANLLDNVRRIAVFLSQDGELNTQVLIKKLWNMPNVETYLPVLETRPEWHMGFASYKPNSKLSLNKFNIPEPDVKLNEHFSGDQMDLVIVPLVGFDRTGNRMGMGGGYYDRTFEFKLQKPNTKPLLVGWAHYCQQVEQIEREVWDVSLDAIVTEKGLLTWP